MTSQSRPRQAGHGESAEGHARPLDLGKALSEVGFPATKADLVRQARDGAADDAVVDLLIRLPDREYDTQEAVSRAIGQLD